MIVLNWWEEEDARAKYLVGQPTNLTVDQKFRRILKLLRQDFPCDHPVKVRRLGHPFATDKAPWGDCGLVNEYKSGANRYFLIRLAKKADWNRQFETLLHEWTHCLTWQLVGNGKDHCDSFARRYGVLYRKYIED